MMTTLLKHLKSNAIGYLALFVALGGTSYAAVSLPTGSVGTKQLRNGSVTASKLAKGAVLPSNLNSKTIAGHIAMWAKIRDDGLVISSSPRVTTLPGPAGIDHVTFSRPVSSRCLALAGAFDIAPATIAGSANVSGPVRHAHSTEYLISTFNGGGILTPQSVNVVVVCP